ncbi:rhodanese-like domain-containing protein [Streptomyces aidingensis]|uniref:Rhodanese-related sulfurtransferase n=1 Tax=Streptomyces aidingensis TaxID=910347 RepID=A0A1I1T4M5_9ACTN|nr:rhodanese-like domain-containing protein [Streptomyces aidingensis]SFD50340.1 Rhodanese-related sulfurtransferase [Streptomyces aidingensis]
MTETFASAAASGPSVSPALRVPAAGPAEAAAFFLSRLTFQADVSDVHLSLESGAPGFVLADSRSSASWAQGRIPGAVHLPTADIPARAGDLLDPAVPVITYCWGPACDGATRAALALARLGYRVKEMIGGMEYWIREGLPVATDTGTERRAADPLTAPVAAVTCGC